MYIYLLKNTELLYYRKHDQIVLFLISRRAFQYTSWIHQVHLGY